MILLSDELSVSSCENIQQKTIRCFVSQLDALTRDSDMKGFKNPRQIRILE